MPPNGIGAFEVHVHDTAGQVAGSANLIVTATPSRKVSRESPPLKVAVRRRHQKLEWTVRQRCRPSRYVKTSQSSAAPGLTQ